MLGAGPRSTKCHKEISYGYEFAGCIGCWAGRGHREESLPPHAIGLCSAEATSSAGLDDVSQTLLDRHAPLPWVSPEEQVFLPETASVGHLRIQKTKMPERHPHFDHAHYGTDEVFRVGEGDAERHVCVDASGPKHRTYDDPRTP